MHRSLESINPGTSDMFLLCFWWDSDELTAMKFHEMLRKKSSQIPSTKVGIPRYSAGTVLMVKPLVGALRPCACPAGQLVGELVERLWLGSIPKCLKCLTLWICLVYKHGNRKVPCLVGKSLNVHCRARSRNHEFYLCSTIYLGWWSSMPDILSISFVHTRKPSQNIHRHTKILNCQLVKCLQLLAEYSASATWASAMTMLTILTRTRIKSGLAKTVISRYLK